MTESEFQKLLISTLDRLDDKLDGLNGRTDRLENGQCELHRGVRELNGKVDRVLEIVQGLAGARANTNERVAALERAASR